LTRAKATIMRAPDFWDRKTNGLWPSLLRPIGGVVSMMAAWRQTQSHPWKAGVPIICVGNLVVGGAGKTPIAIDIIARLKAKGMATHVIMRGYGGTEIGPVLVDPKNHSFATVGDEALLLTQNAPTWVSRDRKAGIEAAIKAGAQVIVMDDGFQNPSVFKDLSILVVDGQYGFGNGRVMPAGPLRENIEAGLKRADCMALLGADEADVWGRVQRAEQKKLPVLRARIEPTADIQNLKGQDVFAFAGIGRPQKFFDTLRKAECKLVGCKSFDDHHPYSVEEIQHVIDAAAGVLVVTTTKDWVRLSPAHKNTIKAVPIALVWKNKTEIDELLSKVLVDG